MESIDYAVLIIYLVGIFGVGVLLSFKNKNADDMFAAGGESPWWTSGLSAFMTMFSAGTFVVWGGIAYKYGFVAVMINICYGVAAILVGYFVAGKWKKLGVRTPAQFIELRFGSSAVQFYTWSMMIFRVVGSAGALYSLSIMLVALLPLDEGNFLRDPNTGNLSLVWAIAIFGGTVVIYTMAGGLWAVLMTDVLQFIVLNLAVIFIIPLILMKVGGFSGFMKKIPEGFTDLTNNKYTWFFLVGWVMIHFFMVGADWAFAQRFICVPNEKDARKSTYLFGVLYLLSPILWLLPPMIYRVVDQNADPAQAYILACQYVLPAGMLGLMVAAMFSATASMVSSQLNVFAGVLTDELYRRVINPEASDKKLLNAGRVFTIFIGVLLIAVALTIPYLGGIEKVIISITSIMVGPLLAPTIWGLFSRKTATSAIWVTAPVSFVLGFIALILNPGGFLSTLSAPKNFPSLRGFYDSITTIFPNVSNYIANNTQTVNLVIGVVVPIVILTVMHFMATEEAPGVKRVEALIASTAKEQAKLGEQKASRMPAMVVGGSLFLCALMMYSLIFFNKEDHGLLIIFGSVLIFISIAIFAISFLQHQKTVKEKKNIIK